MTANIHRVQSAGTASTRWSRRALLASGATSITAVAVAGSARATSPPDGSVSSAPAGGFASAEDAVAAYIKALAAADFDGAVATFAIEPYVDGFDLASLLNWQGFYQPAGNPQPVPNTDSFNRAINVAHRRAFVGELITNQYFALVNPDFDRTPRGQVLDDEAAVEEFVAALEGAMVSAPLAELATYEFIGAEEVDAESAEILAGERSVEQNEQLLKVAGADESAELVARTTVSGTPIALILRAVRYGEAWWVETLHGLLSRIIGIDALSPGVVWLDGLPDDSDPDPAGTAD